MVGLVVKGEGEGEDCVFGLWLVDSGCGDSGRW